MADCWMWWIIRRFYERNICRELEGVCRIIDSREEKKD